MAQRDSQDSSRIESGSAQASVLRSALEQLTVMLRTSSQAAATTEATRTEDGQLHPILLLNWRSAISEQKGKSFLASTESGALVICEGTPAQPGRVLWRVQKEEDSLPVEPAQPVPVKPAAPPPPAPVAPPPVVARPWLSPTSPPSPPVSIPGSALPTASVVARPALRPAAAPLFSQRVQSVHITSRVSGKRLAMDMTRPGAGARLVLQDENCGEHQRFTLTPQPHQGGFHLSASRSPLIINAALGRRNEGWQLIEMGGKNGAESVFAIEPTADGDFRIRAPQSGRWLATANITGVEMPVLDASQGEEQAGRWMITVANDMPRLGLLDLMSVAPRPKTPGALDVLAERGHYPAVDALANTPFRAFTGDFLRRGRDQLMLVRVEGKFHHIDLLDFVDGAVVASATVEPGGWIDGWLGPNDLQLVGDLAGEGYSQLLLLHRGQRRPGEQALLVGLQENLVTPSKLYADNWGETRWLDGWLDPDDVHLLGDFMGLGYDQWMMLNRHPRGGRVRIVDIKSGTPRRCYTEMWGQSPVLDGWMDAGRLMLVGDFLRRGHAQVLFINRNVSMNTGKMMIADFCRAAPPADIGYREMWGQSDLLNEFLGDQDIAVAGDFMGRGYSQVLFVSRKGYGDKFIIADFHRGAPPFEPCVREKWGQREKDARHESLIVPQSVVLAGRFRRPEEGEFAPAQVILI